MGFISAVPHTYSQWVSEFLEEFKGIMAIISVEFLHPENGSIEWTLKIKGRTYIINDQSNCTNNSFSLICLKSGDFLFAKYGLLLRTEKC